MYIGNCEGNCDKTGTRKRIIKREIKGVRLDRRLQNLNKDGRGGGGGKCIHKRREK